LNSQRLLCIANRSGAGSAAVSKMLRSFSQKIKGTCWARVDNYSLDEPLVSGFDLPAPVSEKNFDAAEYAAKLAT
jgi:hypothetical protein